LKAVLARAVYSTALRLLLPALLLRLLWRARREPTYGHALAERLGLGPATPPGALWLHAVSLGETRAAEPLIHALRAARPSLRLLLTHGTATGREAGAALLRGGDAQRWLPLDTPGATRRFLQRHRPAVGVLMETEVWPNLLHAAARAGVPMVLANARLSEKSLRQSLRFDALLRPAVATLRVLAQTEADATRLRTAGATVVQVCGNLKFDLQPDPALLALGQRWRAAAAGRPVVLAASWREGEDAPLLADWAAALAAPAGRQDTRAVPPGHAVADARHDPRRPLLVLVPRHPQRFDEVAALVRSAGFSVSRRSAWGAGPDAMPDAAAAQADVWLGDSMREMPAWYALADVALLGGSFAPLGGQNLIEAAACGCPVVMGPHTFNFADAARGAEAAGAALRAVDLAEAVRQALALAVSPVDRAQRSEAATHYARIDRGAAQRMSTALLRLSR
jgi:3-deoxy-D-manno-octulosonic-acid transferase